MSAETERPRPRSYAGPEIALMAFPDPDPVVHYAERGAIFDLVGPSKKGKTTFTLLGCKAVLAGEPYLGMATKRVPILYLTEQTRRSFRDKLEAIGLLLDSESFHVFFIADFTGLSWREICEIVREEVRAHDVGLLYIDTLTDWAQMENENDAAEALCVMRPLRIIAEDGVAVVTCRHSGKGRHDEQEVVDVGRGSSAFAGVVDTLCVMGGVKGQGHPNQRQLRFVSRKDGIPSTLVIELKAGNYVSLGDAPNVEYVLARDFVLGHLPGREGDALTEKEILAACQGAFSRSTLKRVLNGSSGQGGLIREGLVTGKLGASPAQKPSATGFSGARTASWGSAMGTDLSTEGAVVLEEHVFSYREDHLDTWCPCSPLDSRLAAQPPAQGPGDWDSKHSKAVKRLSKRCRVWTLEALP